jgi:SAM-dependent methyltransferase
MAEPLSSVIRDTDADWRKIGDSQPFWGVLTHPEYLRENINAEHRAAFYATGMRFIASVVAEFERITAIPFRAESALDFGCGTGRLTEAMTAYSSKVVGYDISPGMLQEARASGTGKAGYTDQLPDGPFEWINSYIVFQHIPPERGLPLLQQLLARLAPAGFVSLHFTIYRDSLHVVPSKPRPKRAYRGWRRIFRPSPPFLRPSPPPDDITAANDHPCGTVLMFDYDLNRLCEALHSFGIERLHLVHENHGGHHGVKIFGRRKLMTTRQAECGGLPTTLS